ncbi:PadR family transcriptional regulator [Trueperella sp. LYQ143]|uniref:PadR family transcriptional regulator n=1 Tax=unclassified Trueperella TaxID=2630174 RepID=UPI003983C138
MRSVSKISLGAGAEWQRSLLPFLLMKEMAKSPGHGYGLAQRLANAGFYKVAGAKLYPALNRLESDGLCCATWEGGEGGPGRKVYRLTELGRQALAEQSRAWSELVDRIAALG